MKTHSDELFQLVAHLSLSERRYCSLHLKKHGDEHNRYLQLFELLKRAENYNSAAVRQQLGYSKKPAHYSVLKKQLYEQLLDALYYFDLFSNAEQKLMARVQQCHLLLQKGLFKQCEKRIAVLWKAAQQMNHYEAQLQLQNLKMVMKARKYYRQVDEAELLDWKNETLRVLHDIEVNTQYRYGSSLAFKLQYDSGGRSAELAQKLKTVMQLPQFSNEKNATTPRAQLDYLQVKALYHFSNMENEKAAQCNARFLQLLDDKPMLRQQNADRYFSVLNNYLIDCLLLKQYDTLEEGLTKLRSLTGIAAFKKLSNFEANAFRLGALLEMNYRIATGSFDKAYRNIAAINNGLQQHADKIVKHNRITLHYLSAYVCFALAKYDEALTQLWPILQEKETAVAEDVQLAARMLQLLCHFEKGDVRLLDSLIKSIRRLILKKDEAYALQKTVLTFITASLRLQQIETKHWHDLQKKLQKQSSNKKAAGALNLFNYNVWVGAHVNGRGFGEEWGMKKN